jgi:hypothetical protein
MYFEKVIRESSSRSSPLKHIRHRRELHRRRLQKDRDDRHPDACARHRCCRMNYHRMDRVTEPFFCRLIVK